MPDEKRHAAAGGEFIPMPQHDDLPDAQSVDDPDDTEEIEDEKDEDN